MGERTKKPTRAEKNDAIAHLVQSKPGIRATEVGERLYMKWKEPAKGRQPTRPVADLATDWARSNLRRVANLGRIHYDPSDYGWYPGVHPRLKERVEAEAPLAVPSEPVTFDTALSKSPVLAGAWGQAENEGNVVLPKWLFRTLVVELLTMRGE